MSKNQENQLEKAKAELEELKTKYDVELQVNIDFPVYKVLPDELQLALRVIAKENPQFIVSLAQKPAQDDNAQ